MINAKITGVGGYVPEKLYDNAYMESIVDTNERMDNKTYRHKGKTYFSRQRIYNGYGNNRR